MKIKIDGDLCQGHGACMEEAPMLFHVDDDGKLTVLDDAPAAELRDKLELARQYCPTGAIAIDG